MLLLRIIYGLLLCGKTVADENLQKNINQMRKSLKQVETDVKNAQKDKTAESNDKFAPVMTISFTTAQYLLLVTGKWCLQNCCL